MRTQTAVDLELQLLRSLALRHYVSVVPGGKRTSLAYLADAAKLAAARAEARERGERLPSDEEPAVDEVDDQVDEAKHVECAADEDYAADERLDRGVDDDRDEARL